MLVGSGIAIHQIQHVRQVERRLMAGMWCRLALHCGEQRQQPTLQRRRLAPKKDACPHFLLLRKCAAQDASQVCV